MKKHLPEKKDVIGWKQGLKSVRERGRRSMKIADMHCDTIMRLYEERKGEYLRENTIHVDLAKMKSADYLLQNFAQFLSVWTGQKILLRRRCRELTSIIRS